MQQLKSIDFAGNFCSFDTFENKKMILFLQSDENWMRYALYLFHFCSKST